MEHLWLKIKVWTKVTVIALVAIYLILFLINNQGQPVHIWYFFGHEVQTSLLQLIPLLLLAGVLGWFVIRLGWHTFRQLQELQQRKHASALAKDVADIKAKSAATIVPPPEEPIPLEPPPAKPIDPPTSTT